jgi:hypothetical protein
MDWIDLAQESDDWRALVNTVMHFRVLYWQVLVWPYKWRPLE